MAKDKRDKEAADKAMREYRAARAELNAYRPRDVDDKYLRLNRAVIEAEKKVSWWKR